MNPSRFLRTIWRILAWTCLSIAACAQAQSDCKPFDPDSAKVVSLGFGALKTVVGPLASFDPCHRSVRLDTPSFFAWKRGEKPPVIIIAHGGGGLGGYEREFARLMNQQGFATLIFDAFEMNGLTSGSELVLYFMTNSARQRMIFKATWGAYQWILKNDKVDASRIFFQGLSNGASVVINMAAAVDSDRVRGVIAEGGPSAGIGFPDQIKVPLLLIYGSADNYGGNVPEDLMYTRSMRCRATESSEGVPPGVAQRCSRFADPAGLIPSPLAWFRNLKTAGADIRLELIEGGGHGMMFWNYSAGARQLSDGRTYYTPSGASGSAREQLKRLVLEFLESRL